MNNFFLVVLDGLGVGELPDAALYGDQGSSTLPNMADAVGGLNLPRLQLLGLGNIVPIKGINKTGSPLASFGKMKEVSKGKDSTTGHWELSGFRVDTDFSYFPDGFPKKITDDFLKYTGCKGFLGNKPASGTEIIKELGDMHVKTCYPIIYTSADSVFQIAAHEKIIPLERLYEICSLTREKVLVSPWVVGRVIARPFIGKSGSYTRTANRKDFSIDPFRQTILDVLSVNNITTVAIGKINDLFNYRGIKIREETKSNREGMEKLLKYTTEVSGAFIFTNLVDFDVYFGHRNDPIGFAGALAETDEFFKIFIDSLDESDALLITSDHGNDPTTPSTDHSREYVPLLFYRRHRTGINLGTRETFSDAAKTAADFFNVENDLMGTSFLRLEGIRVSN